MQEENAKSFIDAQKKRISKIESQVLEATGCILPSKAESMSITELAGLCRMVQESNRLQMEQLRKLLEAAGCEVPWNENWEKKLPLFEEKKIQFTLIRRPLDRVSEGDVETEGATTPGSMLGGSSPFSSSRKQSLTPTTPTMDGMSFSASTSSILKTKAKSLGGYVGVDSADNDHDQRKEIHTETSFGDAFRDDDDMITIDTHSTLAGISLQSLQKRADAIDEIINDNDRSEWRLPSTLEEVEESIAESRPSDEANFSRSHMVDNSLVEQSTLGDDSTNVVATVVADDRRKFKNIDTSLNQEFDIFPKKKDRAYGNLSATRFRRPTHILVDGAASSPAHTNITMDATMMNDTLASLAINGEDDNISTMTPILDRYRLDADDCSLGIRVVPNKRGQRSRDSLQSYQASFDIPEILDHSSEVNSNQRHLLSTPMSLPASVSARKKKTFRKTPYPKKDPGKVVARSLEEENGHPNITSESFSSPNHQSPFTSITVPPLRPRSLDPAGSLTSKPAANRNRSLPLNSQAATPNASRKTTRHRVHNESTKLQPNASADEALDLLRQNFSGPITRNSNPGKWIEKITMAEYEVAPLVVRQQVARDEVNEASSLLEQFLTSRFSDSHEALEFTEGEAHDALKDYLFTEKKCKSVLLSLCHWRRLLMHRDDVHGMRFVVNQFEQ